MPSRKKPIPASSAEALPRAREIRTYALQIPATTILKLCAALALIWIVLRLIPTLLLLMVSLLLAVTLAPIVARFEKRGLSRGLAVLAIAMLILLVIVSIVAYFFLIGRYGLRVGDRVTITGVTGDVLEIGLVRLYLMEMTGGAADLQPSGRIVGFSNSVFFEPSALFRQMPGADYVWHSVALTLAPDTDLQLAESRLMAAVEAVYEPYRE